MSGLVHKVKDALSGDSHKHGNNVPEGTAGPHNSRAANAADPRVDSDLDGSRRTAGTHATGTHATGTHTTGTHTTGTHATTGSSNVPEGTYGPHSSRVANAADPRVDSDLDRTGHHAGTTRTAGHGEFGSTGAAYGSHGTHTTGAGSGVTGMTGTHGAPTGTYGTHNSRVANAADPRIDSDRDGRAALGHAPGPAANTAGPHKNDMLNKVDPRVDSDMDGSRTMGGNKTYQ